MKEFVLLEFWIEKKASRYKMTFTENITKARKRVSTDSELPAENKAEVTLKHTKTQAKINANLGSSKNGKKKIRLPTKTED